MSYPVELPTCLGGGVYVWGMDFLIPLLGGALGAALINGVFGLYKIRRDAETEHVQWRRDQRQSEYTKFLTNLFNVKHHLEAVWDDRKYPQNEDDKADPWVEILENVTVLMQQRHVLFLISPQPVLAFANDVTGSLDALLQIAARTKLNPKTDELKAAWAETNARLETAIDGFIGIAKLDLGLLIEDKQHERDLKRALKQDQAKS